MRIYISRRIGKWSVGISAGLVFNLVLLILMLLAANVLCLYILVTVPPHTPLVNLLKVALVINMMAISLYLLFTRGLYYCLAGALLTAGVCYWLGA